MSSTNNYRDTTDADILNKLRQDIESAKAGNTAQNNFTLNYISPNAETIDITDAISINGNLQSVSDTIDITDSVVQTSVNTGLFEVEDDSSYQKLWLSFDQDYVDKSGNQNAGTLTGAETYVSGAVVYPDGRSNKAFSFNGSSYIGYGNICSFERTDSFSVGFWINFTSSSACQVIQKRATSGVFQGWFIQVNGGNIYFDLFGTTSGGNKYIEAKCSIVNDGNWHHIVFTYSGNSDISGVKFYLDGINTSFVTDSNNLGTNTIINTDNLVVGASSSGSSPFSGSLDDLQIWNYAASQAEINTLQSGQQIAHNPAVTPVAKVEFCDCAA